MTGKVEEEVLCFLLAGLPKQHNLKDLIFRSGKSTIDKIVFHEKTEGAPDVPFMMY
jgi:hypothetical protein